MTISFEYGKQKYSPRDDMGDPVLFKGILFFFGGEK